VLALNSGTAGVERSVEVPGRGKNLQYPGRRTAGPAPIQAAQNTTVSGQAPVRIIGGVLFVEKLRVSEC
jgi:hypothetical protein